MGATPAIDEALRALAGTRPERIALVSDFDGCLADLTDDPAAAAMPDTAREALTALGDLGVFRAVLSGRRAADAARRTGIGGMAYSGHYGAEVLDAGATQVAVEPEWGRWTGAISDLGARRYDETGLRNLGVVLDNAGGGIAAFHYRHVTDEATALLHLREIAWDAEQRGMSVLWGTGLMEIRPPVTMTKREGMHRLLDGRDFDVVVYIGDTRPDIEGFKALREMVASGRAKRAICIGVRSGYTPPELEAASDVMVDGVAGVTGFLHDAARAIAQRRVTAALRGRASALMARARQLGAEPAADHTL